ncbi:serine/threonine protein kinase [Striga asiatica]|uniref:Serine/threonine protein kinase n=1 Tax=Striga asiatica TaxID=4170 RepID=A0A5A7QMS8_STRAF|nr:serine/threonine protein kinase [Striga asiatica]
MDKNGRVGGYTFPLWEMSYGQKRPSSLLIWILRDTVEAVNSLHEKGELCYNMKLSNILLHVKGYRLEVNLSILTVRNKPDCNTIWCSKEEHTDVSDKKSNVWRLGLVLYYCLSGCGLWPFSVDTVKSLTGHALIERVKDASKKLDHLPEAVSLLKNLLGPSDKRLIGYKGCAGAQVLLDKMEEAGTFITGVRATATFED